MMATGRMRFILAMMFLGLCSALPAAERASNTGRVNEITFDDIKLDMQKGDPYDSSKLTDKVKSFDGKRIKIRGYILPGFQQNGIKQFVLVRDNGMKQEVNAETFGSGAQSIALWRKNYTFTKTESRKYMIVVKGHKATALWVPVRANCSSGPAGGFSNGPIPTN